MRGLAIDARMARLGFDLRGIPGLEAAWLSRFPYGLSTMRLPDDGTPMGTWVDLSGKGRDLTQATGANQPLWKVNSGIPGFQFDGVSDVLQTVALAGWPETTVYAVATPLSMSTTGVIAMHRSSSAGWYFTFRSPDISRVDWNNAADNGSGGGMKVGGAALLTSEMQSSGNVFYINGANTKSSSVPFAPSLSKAISVGRGDDGGWPLSGLIHDVLICSQAHDDTTRQRIEAWLARKNGVTLAA